MTVQEMSHKASSPLASEPESSNEDDQQPCSDHEASAPTSRSGSPTSDGSHIEERSPDGPSRTASPEGSTLMPPAVRRREFDHSPPPDVHPPDATVLEPLRDHEVRSKRLWEMLKTMDRTDVKAVDELCRTIIRKDDIHIFELLDLPETVDWVYLENYMQSLLRYVGNGETALQRSAHERLQVLYRRHQLWKKTSEQSPYGRSLNTAPGPLCEGWSDPRQPINNMQMEIPCVPFTRDTRRMRLLGYRESRKGGTTGRHFIICPRDETYICDIRTGTEMGREFVSTFVKVSPNVLPFGESVDRSFLRDHHPIDGQIKAFLVAQNKRNIHVFVQYVNRHGASHSSWLSRDTMHTILGASEADRVIGEIFEEERHPVPWVTAAKPEVRPADQQPEVTPITNAHQRRPKTNAEDQCGQSKVANGTKRLTGISWDIRDPVEKARSVDGHPLNLDAEVFPSKVTFEFGDRYWDYSWKKCVTDTTLRGVLQITKDEYENYEANYESMGDGVWFTSVTYDEADDVWTVDLEP